MAYVSTDQRSACNLFQCRNTSTLNKKMMNLLLKDMEKYIATAKARWEEKQVDLEQRRKKALEVTRIASELLKKRFNAKKVMLFGSTLHNYWYSSTSDIDIAAWGIEKESYLIAVSKLQDISPEFDIDLVSINYCKPDLLKTIIEEGLEI